jgi:hypothetical protein
MHVNLQLDPRSEISFRTSAAGIEMVILHPDTDHASMVIQLTSEQYAALFAAPLNVD